MSGTLPSLRRIAGALAVLTALPAPALAVLAERLIERLDALAAPGVDLEPDDDGEADQDNEAGPWDGDAIWTPATGPVECGPMRLGAPT